MRSSKFQSQILGCWIITKVAIMSGPWKDSPLIDQHSLVLSQGVPRTPHATTSPEIGLQRVPQKLISNLSQTHIRCAAIVHKGEDKWLYPVSAGSHSSALNTKLLRLHSLKWMWCIIFSLSSCEVSKVIMAPRHAVVSIIMSEKRKAFSCTAKGILQSSGFGMLVPCGQLCKSSMSSKIGDCHLCYVASRNHWNSRGILDFINRMPQMLNVSIPHFNFRMLKGFLCWSWVFLMWQLMSEA